MKLPVRLAWPEIAFTALLAFGIVILANAQTQNSSNSPQKTVKVEVEVTEDGRTSRTIQELTLDRESINGQLDEMIEEIEEILEEAVQDIEETDLEITIRRNTTDNSNQAPQYRSFVSVFPDVPNAWHMESEPRAFLGVYGAQYIPEGDDSGVDEGVILTGIVDGSAAQTAGLQEGDIVKRVGDTEVSTFGELAKAVKSHKPGEDVEIELVRDGQVQTVSAELGQREGIHVSHDGHSYHYNYSFDGDFDFDFDFDFDDLDHAKGISSSRAYLGVRGHNLRAEDEVDAVEQGAYIESIIENTAAEEGGLKQGDVIIRMDGEEVDSFDKLGEVIRTREAGEEVDVVVIRDGQEETIQVTLGERKVNHYEFQHPKKPCKPKWDEEAMSKKPFLGVMIKTEMEDEDEVGARVTEVYENSTAEAMGLQEGDIIYEMNDEVIENVGDLMGVMGEVEPGDEMKVEFRRDGKKMKETGTLKSKADHKDLMMQDASFMQGPNDMNVWVRKMHISVDVEELEEDEIKALNEKSGERLDESNSLDVAELSFTPNPNNGQFKIMFDLPETGDTKIQVFDQNGRSVFDQNLRDFSGIYSNQIDISSEAAGIYFVSITQNGKGKVARVVKQ